MNEKKKKRLKKMARILSVELEYFSMIARDLEDEQIDQIDDVATLLLRYAKGEL